VRRAFDPSAGVRQPENDYSAAVQRCLSADQSESEMNRASPDWGKRARACEASDRHHASEHDRDPDAAAQCGRVVQQRLVDEFPDVAPTAVKTLIRKEHARFETSQIRDFVPLLVEKRARRELKHKPSISPMGVSV
jgi:hypothetical protein